MQCKAYAFHCFLHVPMCSHLLGFSTPCLAASPQLLALPPLQLQRRKTQKGGEVGGKLWVEGVDMVKVMRGWSEAGARLERWWNEGWGVEKVIKNWYQIQGYIYCIYSHPLCYLLLGILSFPFHFSAAFSLSPALHPSTCPSPLNTLIPLSEKNVRGRTCREEWAGMESGES